jgi:cytochrome c-type biogenesis protein CcsB
VAPVEAILFWGAVALYALATGGIVYGIVFANDRFVRRMIGLATAGFAAHGAAIAARYLAQGHLPWAGDYENGLLGGWFVVAFTLVVAWRQRALQAIAVATLPLAFLLMGYGAMRNPVLTPLEASLKSNWLVVHVFFAWLAFGAYALAMGGGIVWLLKRRAAARAGAGATFYDRVPSLDRLDELVFRWIVFGFVTDAVMIVSGAIWARDLWGSYWSWDPVETWSLVTWFVYGLAIHLRVTRGWRGARFAWVAVLAIAGMVITFFGVTFVVETSNHFFNVR